MQIHFELPVADFIQFLLNCVHERKTGIVMFFSDSADWGKIVISNGTIVSVRFKVLKGTDALPQIKALQMVQYHFRTEDSSHITLIRDTDISNESFFGYFGVTLTPSEPTIEKDSAHTAVVGNTAFTAIPAQRKNTKILVADDSPTARKAISRILIEAGYQVVEARNGFETLGQLENERPNLLLLDLIMPGIDGYGVLRAIARTQGTERIPIVVLTSRDSLFDKLKGMALTCDAYLTKPVQSDTLLEMAAKYLPT